MADPKFNYGDSGWDIIRKILDKLFNIYDRLGDIWDAIKAGGGGGGGDATKANQVLQIAQETAINASTASVDGKTPTVGQKTMAASSPVVVASDQSAIPITAAALPLPAGASTSANQTSQITQETAIATSVASLDTKTPTVGQKAMAASSPVVLASDQSSIPVTVASLPLPAGGATSANQTTQITAEQAIQAALQGVSASFASVADIVVPTAGTRVQGANISTPRGCIISSRASNTGQVYVGDVNVSNAGGVAQSLILAPAQQSPILLVANLNQIYINSDNNNDAVGVLRL